MQGKEKVDFSSYQIICFILFLKAKNFPEFFEVLSMWFNHIFVLVNCLKIVF